MEKKLKVNCICNLCKHGFPKDKCQCGMERKCECEQRMYGHSEFCPPPKPEELFNSEKCTCEALKKELGWDAVCRYHEFKHLPTDFKDTSDEWEKIKDKYSQSGWFDSIRDIKELDNDIHSLLSQQEAKVKGELIHDILQEFQCNEMLPNNSGYIGIKEAKQWAYDIISHIKSK